MSGFLVLELIFGWWLKSPKGWDLAERLNIIRDRTIQYDVTGLYGDGDLTATYSRDLYGLRDTCRTPSEIDLVTIGGSTTDQRYISDGQTWQDVLQEDIRDRSGDADFCVTNAGVDGHTTFGHIASVESWFPLIPGFKPDYYVLYVGLNDAGFRYEPNGGFEGFERSAWKSKSALWQGARNLREAFRSWEFRAGSGSRADNVYAGHAARVVSDTSFTATAATTGTEELESLSEEGFRRNLDKLLVLISDRGGTPVCVAQPHQLVRTIEGELKGVTRAFSVDGRNFNGIDYHNSLTSMNDVMERLCPTYGGHYIELTGVHFDSDDYYDYLHMTPEGAAKVGYALAVEFDRLGLPARGE